MGAVTLSMLTAQECKCISGETAKKALFPAFTVDVGIYSAAVIGVTAVAIKGKLENGPESAPSDQMDLIDPDL